MRRLIVKMLNFVLHQILWGDMVRDIIFFFLKLLLWIFPFVFKCVYVLDLYLSGAAFPRSS